MLPPLLTKYFVPPLLRRNGAHRNWNGRRAVELAVTKCFWSLAGRGADGWYPVRKSPSVLSWRLPLRGRLVTAAANRKNALVCSCFWLLLSTSLIRSATKRLQWRQATDPLRDSDNDPVSVADTRFNGCLGLNYCFNDTREALARAHVKSNVVERRIPRLQHHLREIERA